MQKRSIIRRSTIIPTEVMAPYWHDTMDLVAADLSPKGMYLISDKMPSVGEFVFCTFSLKHNEPDLKLLSRVKRVNWHRRKNDRLRPGFGVEFLGLNMEQYQRISKALIGMPPPVPTPRRQRAVPSPVPKEIPFCLSTPKTVVTKLPW